MFEVLEISKRNRLENARSLPWATCGGTAKRRASSWVNGLLRSFSAKGLCLFCLKNEQ